MQQSEFISDPKAPNDDGGAGVPVLKTRMIRDMRTRPFASETKFYFGVISRMHQRETSPSKHNMESTSSDICLP